MSIDREEVLSIARLARLSLTPGEVDALTADLGGILDHMQDLAAADLGETGRIATSSAAAPLRDDRVAPDALHRDPAQIAPDWREGFFVVPRLAALDGSAAEEDAS